MDPFEQDDLRPTIETERKKRPTEAAIDVKSAPSCLLRSFDATVAPGREPKRRYAGESPLSPMTMPAKNEIDVMMLFQLFKNIGGMG